MDIVLDSGTLSCARAARFVLSASALIGDGADKESAFREAVSRGLLQASLGPNDPITLGQLSLLLMKSFNMKGGLFYSLFPSARYAYRELVYKRCIQGRSDPAHTVSGEQFMLILGRVLSQSGGGL
jgi:hypothetical protein